ncbi:IS1/IS1595 family N-terminal zinc-binding domain-containing protein [Thermococcus henrietii]|uniref:IS1/IS1595 family N-terminal zinc-binding domain-containing protein n=1 Tax=Thermococcus henrietii TaxID=2016361 RepID=UPI0011AB3DDE|nr:IS1 family transposase [Thermococcus henrietii]
MRTLREGGVLRVLRRLLSTPEEIIVARALEISPPRCPECGSASLVRIGGIVKACGLRIQRFRCKVCGRTFTELEGTPLKGLHDIKFAVVVAYLVLCLGMEPKTIARVTGRPYSTVMRLSRKARENEAFFRKLFRALGVTSVTRYPNQ